MSFLKFLVHVFFILTIGLFAWFTFERAKIGSSSSDRLEIVKLSVGTGVFVLLYALFLFIRNSESASSAELTTKSAEVASSYAAPEARNVNAATSPGSVTTTLENVRFKGDSVKIQCSGPTGSVVCKSVK